MCERESEMIESLRSGRMEPDLRAHASECSSCADLIDVAGALLDDRRTLMREAQIPSSGLMWWRTSLRARQEAARRAMIAGRVVQAALVVIAALGAMAWTGVGPAELQNVFASIGRLTLPLVAAAALLILAPVAVYFVLAEK